MKLGWYSLDTFDVLEYSKLEEWGNGHINWVIPGKFLAFMGPVDDGDETNTKKAEDFVEDFKRLKVSQVIRLNEP
jgi:cell division cycle 14